MDQATDTGSTDSVIVSGAGYCLQAPDLPRTVGESLQIISDVDIICDDTLNIQPWLKTPKTHKFMGTQDKLAVIAAGRALQDANLLSDLPQERSGIYLAVGYIPFEQDEINELTRNSQENNAFSMQRFSTDGMDAVNPLLTFRCLPNMPAFHVSVNYSIKGPYYVSYPDCGQFYLAMEQAIQALQSHRIDVALLGGVADQNNFLVENQLNKLAISSPYFNCAGFLVLTRKSTQHNRTGTQLELTNNEIQYQPQDLLQHIPDYCESININGQTSVLHNQGYFGPGSLALMLAAIKNDKNRDNHEQSRSAEIRHQIQTSSNVRATSNWLLTPC